MAMSATASRVLRRVLAIQTTCNHIAKAHKSGPVTRSFKSSVAIEITRNNIYMPSKSSFPTKRSFSSTAASSSSSSQSPTSSSQEDPNRQVRVSHILLPTGSESTIEDFKSQILKGTTTLETLAKQHSTCPSASRGGDIGWIPRGRTVPEFELSAYSTPKGSYATCSTPFGVHLIQVTAEKIAVDVGHCSVQELSELLSSVAVDQDLLDDVQFVDVREPHEVEIVSLPHFKVLPLGSFQDWAPKLSSLLDPSKKTYVLCHHGMRSMQASQFFVENGFSQVWNISGGIDAYSRGVDNNLPRY
jgi:rhodanese-related sulfurtransferase